MPNITGTIRKLVSELNTPIQYHLPIGHEKIDLNTLIGSEIKLHFSKEISCIQCNRTTNKRFQQGYCYPCYRKLLDCNLCIIHPEKCNYPLHNCPDTWAHEHCKQEHIIYLANSSGLKIGITRATQIPTRWIDQGASQAIALFKVKNRHHSGKIEVMFKQFIADKTNWRKMLSDKIAAYDMMSVRQDLLQKAHEQLHALHSEEHAIEWLDESAVQLTYPVQSFPAKLASLTFDKEPIIQGTLMGIKGQYIIMDKGVLNIRKHSGYKISLEY